jgi:nucleotidyltransferase/DNA polymerase involved in DNA repair
MRVRREMDWTSNARPYACWTRSTSGANEEQVMDERDDAALRLRAASDNVVVAAHELLALEDHKRQLAPGDPRFRALAEDARRLAEEILRLAAVCADQARQIEDERLAAHLTSIAATPPSSSLAPILNEWRSVERELATTTAGSPESEALIRRFHALRAQYTHAAARLIDPAEPRQ